MGTTIDEVAFSVLQHQLRERERQATLVRTASSLSHALATPLSVISGRVAMLGAAGGEPAAVQRNVTIIQEQLRIITERLKRLVDFARAGPSTLERVDLVELVRDATTVMQPVAAEQGMTLACTANGSLMATTDRRALVHLLTTIVSVGILTAAAGSPISLGLEARQSQPPPRERGRVRPGPYARISVQCPGSRLFDSMPEDVYEPWFAERPSARTSLALALAIAWGIAREHGGWVDTQVDPASQTIFWVNWPLSST